MGEMYSNFKVIAFICSEDGIGKFRHVDKRTKDGLFAAMKRNYGFRALTEEQFGECFNAAINILGFSTKN